MTWPALVRQEHCRTPITLVIQREGLTEDGAPAEEFRAELLCNWQDGAWTELTEQQKYVKISGRAYFPGDICPEIPHITGGYGEIFGGRRRILRGAKGRNPDGSVNYTEVCFA